MVLVGKSKRPLERLDVDGMIILKWFLDRMEWYALDLSGPGLGPVEGSCEHGNEPSGSITCWEILEWLSDWQLIEKGSAPWSYLVTRCSILVTES
jgi:hypothetical protein